VPVSRSEVKWAVEDNYLAPRMTSSGVYWYMHRQILCLMLILTVYPAPLRLEGQQPLVHGSDVAFTVWTDQTRYSIGEPIVVHYAVKNVSNGALFVILMIFLQSTCRQRDGSNAGLTGYAEISTCCLSWISDRVFPLCVRHYG
jgi:hypothetical protein